VKTHRFQIGPAVFEIRSSVRGLVAKTAQLYRDYPQDFSGKVIDFAVSAEPPSLLRRVYKPNLIYGGDFTLEDIVPVERRLGVLGFEMAINLQMALGYLRHIVIHAASAAKNGDAVLITGESGAGKSTLSALLSYSADWRHMGDELALVTLEDDPMLVPYPRPIGLKNESVAEMQARAPEDRFGPLLTGSVKGDVRHLLPPRPAIDAMLEPARPRLILSPRFRVGAQPEYREMTQSEAYVRLSGASTNQLRLGETGFRALVGLVKGAKAYDITYGSSEQALALVDELWAQA
jgi:HprK-related kinase A